MSIRIDGQARRSFVFPADLESAFAYFTDLDRVFIHLPHISLVKKNGNGAYRMMYHSTELGVYNVRIYADLQAEVDGPSRTLRLLSLPSVDPPQPEAGWNTISAHGSYESESRFSTHGGHTRVDYSLSLQAALPVPGAARVMPGRMRDAVAANITGRRMREIADAFVARSIRAYT